MLGTGLATAQPQSPNIPGVDASGPQNGAKLDPSALQMLQDTTTTVAHFADDEAQGHGREVDDHHDAPEDAARRTCSASATP